MSLSRRPSARSASISVQSAPARRDRRCRDRPAPSRARRPGRRWCAWRAAAGRVFIGCSTMPHLQLDAAHRLGGELGRLGQARGQVVLALGEREQGVQDGRGERRAARVPAVERLERPDPLARRQLAPVHAAAPAPRARARGSTMVSKRMGANGGVLPAPGEGQRVGAEAPAVLPGELAGTSTSPASRLLARLEQPLGRAARAARRARSARRPPRTPRGSRRRAARARPRRRRPRSASSASAGSTVPPRNASKPGMTLTASLRRTQQVSRSAPCPRRSTTTAEPRKRGFSGSAHRRPDYHRPARRRARGRRKRSATGRPLSRRAPVARSRGAAPASLRLLRGGLDRLLQERRAPRRSRPR